MLLPMLTVQKKPMVKGEKNQFLLIIMVHISHPIRILNLYYSYVIPTGLTVLCASRELILPVMFSWMSTFQKDPEEEGGGGGGELKWI